MSALRADAINVLCFTEIPVENIRKPVSYSFTSRGVILTCKNTVDSSETKLYRYTEFYLM